MFEATKQPKAPTGVFVSATVVIFFLTLSAADSVGFVPYYIDGTAPRDVALSDLPELGEEITPVEVKPIAQPAAVVTALPSRVIIDGISLDLPVLNPDTRDIAALDEILKNGPARYVDSAKLGEKGNVLIFAHTSHLPVVHNPMYKAFNRLPELEKGDVIALKGEGREYVYSVTSVRRANAEEEMIDLSSTLGARLTLVTCDTLTSKESRWIVEADFIGSY